ncbi:MAG: hypothetical protein PF961_10745 [Planctomycetota bacterium]|jgi:hypothetical protein|nr:hypothetical protein [Planctomycetota bacterium]
MASVQQQLTGGKSKRPEPERASDPQSSSGPDPTSPPDSRSKLTQMDDIGGMRWVYIAMGAFIVLLPFIGAEPINQAYYRDRSLEPNLVLLVLVIWAVGVAILAYSWKGNFRHRD